MDRQGMKALRRTMDEMFELNADVLQELGVKLRVGTGRFYCDGGGYFKVEIIELKGGKEISREASGYTRMCLVYGMKPEWLNKTVQYRGRLWMVVGLNTRGSKYPVIVERSDGKKFKFTVKSVKEMHGEKELTMMLPSGKETTM